MALGFQQEELGELPLMELSFCAFLSRLKSPWAILGLSNGTDWVYRTGAYWTYREIHEVPLFKFLIENQK
jgi:hypothetical protein